MFGVSYFGSDPFGGIPVGDTTAPVSDITVGPDTTRISRQSGKDVTTFSFESNEDYQAYQLRVVPANSSSVTAGTQIEAGSGGNANTTRQVSVTDAELEAAGGGPGDNIVKLFVQDNAGNWST